MFRENFYNARDGWYGPPVLKLKAWKPLLPFESNKEDFPLFHPSRCHCGAICGPAGAFLCDLIRCQALVLGHESLSPIECVLFNRCFGAIYAGCDINGFFPRIPNEI